MSGGGYSQEISVPRGGDDRRLPWAGMKQLILATVVVSVIVLAGCSSGGSSSSTTSTSVDAGPNPSSSSAPTTLAPGGSRSAEEAVRAYIDAASKDQWGRVWDGLHPAQKALFTREAFIECGAAPPFSVDDVKVIDTYEENSSLPGVSDSVPSTAVTLKITVSSGGKKDTQTLTAHAYEVDGQWWTSVDKDKVAACTSGAAGSALHT